MVVRWSHLEILPDVLQIRAEYFFPFVDIVNSPQHVFHDWTIGRMLDGGVEHGIRTARMVDQRRAGEHARGYAYPTKHQRKLVRVSS